MTDSTDNARGPYRFDRYINGRLMAEGVQINKERNLEDAMVSAAKIASRGSNGEVPVLVYRADIAALTRRLAGTAVDYKELYEAAKRDAEEAEAYAAELEAKLANVLDFCRRLERFADQSGDSFLLEKSREALAELKGQEDE